MDKKPNALQKFVHRFLMLRPVTAVLALFLHRADAAMFRLTGGRHSIAEIVGLPIIQLRMTGAKTKQPRTLPLVGLFDREKIILIGTNFGKKHNPGWYYNLINTPRCEVINRGREAVFMARKADDHEYQQYWELALAYYAGYEKYKQRSAPRQIPIMLLEPVNLSSAPAAVLPEPRASPGSGMLPEGVKKPTFGQEFGQKEAFQAG